MGLYKHSCEFCIFLGNVELRGKVYDLYYCTKDDTVQARWGNNEKVISGLKVAKIEYERKWFGNPLAVAYSIAMAHGLIK